MFRKLAVVMTAGALALGLSACSLWSTLTGDDSAASARAAAYTVLASYADTYQPAVIAYGKLQTCSDTVTTACKTEATLSALKSIDKKATAAVTALHTVLANASDDDDTTATITADTEAIQTAISEISGYDLSTVSTSSN